MPRSPRLHVPGGCYHVVLRGNHRENLFSDAADRAKLDDIVGDVLQPFHARIHAYCWMTNHLHALVQIGDQPLGTIMQRIAMRFSRYRHRALRTTGHLFERRYKAWLVDIDEYFLTLLRYIHRNPVEARMVADPADYPYSSHRAYLGLHSAAWVTTEFGLSLFASDLAKARTAYRQFIASGCDENIEAGIHPEDSRVLGSDDFINKLPFAPYKPRSLATLDQLAAQLCTQHSISIDQLRSPARTRSLTPVRLHFVRTVIDNRAGTLSDAARFLHRDPSAIVKLLARYPSS